jgi:hypothetical protein
VRKSGERILTAHVGSLPRSPALRDLLVQQDYGEAVDGAALAREVEVLKACEKRSVGVEAVDDVVGEIASPGPSRAARVPEMRRPCRDEADRAGRRGGAYFLFLAFFLATRFTSSRPRAG